ARFQKTLKMFFGAEYVQLLRRFIPIRADAAKAARAVIERVRCNADFGLGERNKFAFKKCPLAHRRRAMNFLASLRDHRVGLNERLDHRVLPCEAEFSDTRVNA